LLADAHCSDTHTSLLLLLLCESILSVSKSDVAQDTEWVLVVFDFVG